MCVCVGREWMVIGDMRCVGARDVCGVCGEGLAGWLAGYT